MTRKRIPVTKIDSSVPIPEDVTVVYPFSQMDIGDSFAINVENRQRVASAATKYASRTDKHFTVRKVDEKTVRVWRDK